MAEATATRSSVVPLAAFAAGAVVALLIGVYGSLHDPTAEPVTLLGFGSMIAMKVYLAFAAAVIAIGQVLGGLWLYGKLGIAAPSWLGTAHRLSGLVAVLLATPVALNCLWALGFQAGEGTSTRVLVHSVVGCAVYGALVVKVVAVHSRRGPGWLLPVAGGLLFATLIVAVWTSAVWYVGDSGWPSATAPE
jgi:hypothetical protein